MFLIDEFLAQCRSECHCSNPLVSIELFFLILLKASRILLVIHFLLAVPFAIRLLIFEFQKKKSNISENPVTRRLVFRYLLIGMCGFGSFLLILGLCCSVFVVCFFVLGRFLFPILLDFCGERLTFFTVLMWLV